jgi:hypothetical protein
MGTQSFSSSSNRTLLMHRFGELSSSRFGCRGGDVSNERVELALFRNNNRPAPPERGILGRLRVDRFHGALVISDLRRLSVGGLGSREGIMVS